MSEIVIRAENLSKRYLIRHQAEGVRPRYTALRDVISEKFRHAFSRKSQVENPKEEEFWALKDVSFEIKRGEAVGVIGRNGAGKSTLLKLLSRITEPTAGRIELEGKVSSLLEVGTGFHPELTGRENIFLNGAIMGMNRADIRRKFDEIVAFAEVEKFLDTPVKRYSSGMYMRLAFAVAAHLEPEILIVDEVLAVGDAEFQKKCLGKMNEVTKAGRTVIFVSHNMEAIHRLTSLSLLLVGGRRNAFGTTSEVIKQYQSQIPDSDGSNLEKYRTIFSASVKIIKLWFGDASGSGKFSFLPQEDIYVHMIIQHNDKASLSCEIAFAIEAEDHVPIMASHYSDLNEPLVLQQSCRITVRINPNVLRHGRYYISTGIYSRDFRLKYDEILHLTAFEVEGFHPRVPKDGRWGVVYLPFEWTLNTDTLVMKE